MKKIILSVIICLALAAGAQAQHQGARDALAARVTLHNYQFPFANQWDRADFNSGFEVEYSRHLNNAFNLAIPARLNKASLPIDDMGRTRDAGMASMDALLQLKYFRPDNFIYPYLFAGVGAMYENFQTINAAIPLGVGLNFRLGRNAYLSTKGEYRIGLADLRDHLQISGGILLMLGDVDATPKKPLINDRDGDGVPDQTDLCPDTPGLPQFSGCPDTDGDGIPDGSDDCPTEAGPAALRGCPDRDGDGVPDKDDKCPDEAGPASNQGCPITDRDGDGVPDEIDECPDQPGPAATKGCPDRDGDGVPDKDDLCPDQPGSIVHQGCPDRDGDGVPDRLDKCPDTPGTAANNGCPEIEQKDKETLVFATKAVQFETGNARLKPESFAVLDRVLDILNRYPDYRLSIGGHTDSIGSANDNQSLSERRAQACYDYLRSKGVNPVRMKHAGYGESQPIADNRYKDGREQNRRVEFDLYIE